MRSSIPSESINVNQTAGGRSIYHPTTSWKQLESQYIISDIFAEGNFAHVRKATKKQSKVDFAMKIIAKNKIHGREQIDNEIAVMQR